MFVSHNVFFKPVSRNDVVLMTLFDTDDLALTGWLIELSTLGEK